MLPTPRKFQDNRRSAAHRRAPKQERELAARLNGTPTRGSGSGVDKGDVKHTVLRIECKCTERASFTVTRDMLEKIERAAAENRQWPAIHVEIVEPGTGRILKSFAILPAYVLDEIADTATTKTDT